MKKLLSIIFSAFFIMSCCFVNAFSVNCKNKESNRVLSRSEIVEANKSISPTSTDDKRTFVNCVFSELGFDSRYVSLLNDNLLEKFASAEEYGFCEKADLSPSSESSVLVQ